MLPKKHNSRCLLFPNKTFARTISKSLGPRNRRLLGDLLPQVAAISYLQHIQEASQAGKELILEVGFGTGDNFIAMAKANTNKLYIGAEPFLNGVGKVLQYVEDTNASNIFIHAGDVRELLLALKPLNVKLHEIYVLFPDPWPKVQQHKKRLLERNFLRLLTELMDEESGLFIATDHIHYAEWIIKELEEVPQLRYDYSVNKALFPHTSTKFASKCLKLGHNIHYFKSRIFSGF